MKTKSIILNLIIVIVTIGALSSCKTTNIITTESGKQIDSRLVGIWKGCEKGFQFQDTKKCWTMERKEDGKFILEFAAKFESKLVLNTEKGTWWIENGKFYEFHNNSQKTDIYEYEVINKNEILFKSIVMEVDMNSEIYTFSDYREGSKQEKNLNIIKDGSSTKNAIKVSNISEEYTYVENICPGCRVISQALIFEKKKPFDLLEVKKPDGTIVMYYFDISSFFGKSF